MGRNAVIVFVIRGVIRETPVPDVPIVPAIQRLCSVQGLRLFKVQSFKSSTKDKTRRGELPCFENSRNVERLRSRRGVLTDFDLNP
jgi:hypothetical protein